MFSMHLAAQVYSRLPAEPGTVQEILARIPNVAKVDSYRKWAEALGQSKKCLISKKISFLKGK